jgi:uncharacterized membrane protein YukC
MKTVTVELTNQNALRLLKDLELANIIRLIDTSIKEKIKLSAKLRGSMSKERAKELNDQLSQMREEWNERGI